MKINVDHDDILRGHKASCMSCPVARALSRATYKLFDVGTTTCMRMEDLEIFHFPVEVSAWIVAFDKGERVEPMEFELPL